MRKILLAAIAMAFGMGIATSVTPAQAQAPICLHWRDDLTDCRYFSMAQCNASASGIGATCLYNPAYAARVESYDEEPAPRRRSHRRHRHHTRHH